MRTVQKLAVFTLLFTPVTAFGRSAIGAPTQRAGVPAEGAQDCTACHRGVAVNGDARGRLRVQASPYTPGVKQTIRVSLTHSAAARWGFSLTARPMSDETKAAGTFGSSADVQVKCGPFPGATDQCTEGAVQFATHTAAGTKAGTAGGATWEIEWTPPATNVGEVSFFVAANAANNNGANTGDSIYATRVRVQPASGCTVSGTTQLSAVVNGASFAQGGPIGFNTMISLFGTGFGAQSYRRGADHFDFVDDKFPKELGCVSVEINDIDVPVVYVSENQINAQAPALVFAGPAKVEVRVNKGLPTERKAELTVQMREFTPAFFLFGSSKSIAALHSDNAPVADPGVSANGRPAKPGETITLYGTGFGVTSPVWQAGELPSDDRAGRVANPFTVQVGAVTLRPEDVPYAGHSPRSISGLYQVNVRIPDNTPDGNIPVVFRIGGVSSQDDVYIPVKR